MEKLPTKTGETNWKGSLESAKETGCFVGVIVLNLNTVFELSFGV
jgi:hypothetical protein